MKTLKDTLGDVKAVALLDTLHDSSPGGGHETW